MHRPSKTLSDKCNLLSSGRSIGLCHRHRGFFISPPPTCRSSSSFCSSSIPDPLRQQFSINHPSCSTRAISAVAAGSKCQSWSADDLAKQVTIVHNSDLSLTLNSEKFQIHNLKISYVWLRDACQSPSSLDPRTRQKLFKSSDIPINIYPTCTQILQDHETGEIQLKLEWSHQLLSDISQSSKPSLPHSSTFDLSFLKHRSSQVNWQNHRHKQNFLKPVLWNDSQSASSSPADHYITRLHKQGKLFVDYQPLIVGPSHRYQALNRLNQDGLVFFDNVCDQEGKPGIRELERLIECLGVETRRTFYGDFWDVKSQGEEATNVANTSLPLDLHMDLVHFENPPRFQFLHCLKNEVAGGVSTFVDGYAAAQALLTTNPADFRILLTHLIPFEYVNAGHHTYYAHPTFQLHPGISPDDILSGPPEALVNSLRAINYAPPFQGPLRNYGPDGEKALLKALSVFDRICAQDKFRFEILLRPGQCVGFDNRRVLHARTAFVSSFAPQENGLLSVSRSSAADAKRWLKGCYVDGDAVWDRIRVLSQIFGPPKRDHP